MRIAIISDIHSNVYALESVLIDIDKYNVDLKINLGDIFYGPIAPRKTYDLLMKTNFVTIRGNQDRQIYEESISNSQSNSTMQFVIENLGKEPIEWLKTLSFDNHPKRNIYICHGSPTSDLEYLLEDIESGFAQIRSDKDILDKLNGESSQIILCGHTHTSRVVTLSTGQLVVNPGSVGLQAYNDEEPVEHVMENHCPYASYTILEECKDGWNVNQIKVPYNYELAAQEAKNRNRDDWVHFLRTGRGL
jgi:predicted phosphodiesterase